MIIKKWTGTIIKVYRSIKDNKGDKNMEATIRVKKDENIYREAKSDIVMKAINECNKKYAKAMKRLAK